MSGCVVKLGSYGSEFDVARGCVRLGTGVWLPTSVTGLVHWFRADRGVTHAAGGKLSVWANLGDGGGDLAQVSGAAQFAWDPTGLGGKPSLVGDGASTFMQGASPTLGARTYGFAFASTKATESRVFGTSGTTFPLLSLSFDGARSIYIAGSSNFRYFAPTPKYSDGQLHACVLTVPGVGAGDVAGATLEVDGEAIAPSTTATSGTPVADVSNLVLGGTSGGDTRFQGHLGEFVVYNRVLAPEDRQQLAAYLLAR